MSVSDTRGARRRFRARQMKGHAPRPVSRSVAQAVASEKARAARLARIIKSPRRG